MNAWLIFSLVLLLFYLLLLLVFWIGWMLMKTRNKPFLAKELAQFTILIPVRNEEEHILQNLKSLKELNYPHTHFEVHIINDHSNDRTEFLVREFKKDNPAFPLQLINLKDFPGIRNKKEAITFGVKSAKTDWIVLTDGDCKRSREWLLALNEMIAEKPCKMIYAPVEFSSHRTFEHLQALEFMGLVGIGGAAIRLKNPNMCSAANLAFKRDVFLEVGGYTDNQHIASGDDEFLLHKVFKFYPNQVFFLKDIRALVSTSPNASLEQLANQRRRWVSKSTRYDNRYITGILVAAYLFNFSILLNLIWGIFNSDFLQIALIQLGAKTAMESLFLFDILRFFKRKFLILFIILAEPFHIIYVLIIGIWANFASYNWKGRTHN